jgi:DNA-binding transcriptional LysR family regulator
MPGALEVLSSAVETDNLILRPFAIDRLACVASMEHPLIRNGQVRFTDLLGDQFIGMRAVPCRTISKARHPSGYEDEDACSSSQLPGHLPDGRRRYGRRDHSRIRCKTMPAIHADHDHPVA